MANLETLELTISANAESASKGIGVLITSLSSLSNALIKPYSDLRNFNSELKKMKEYCQSIKLPNIAKATGANAAVSRAKKWTPESIKEWQESHASERTYTNGLGFQKGYETDEERAAKNPQWYRTSEEIKQTALEINNLRKEQGKFKPVPEDNRSLAQNSVAIKDLAENMYHYSQSAKEAGQNTSKFSRFTSYMKEGLSNLKDSFSSITSRISSFAKRIQRIAVTMMIRKALRALVAAVKEGVSNLYQWSKLNNGDFASSVDTLKSKISQLKNSVGASIAPVISAAIPIINSLASAAIQAFNYVNQLISLLTGKSSWTKATENVNDYSDAVNKAGGSASDWIATFDELNVMTSNSGGGGSSTSTDYSDMFEEMTEFEEHIQSLANFLKDNVENIRDVALEAGAAFLTWKVSTAFSGVLGTIATLATAGIIMDITWKMTAMFDNQYLKTGEEGWLVADVITNTIGSYLAGTVVKSVLGTGAGLVTAGLTLLISGAISYGIAMANEDNDNAGVLSTVGLIKGAIGDILIGAGFAVATGSIGAGIFASAMAAPLFFIVAGITAEIVRAQSYQELANKVFKSSGKNGISVEELYKTLQNEFDSMAEPYKLSIEAFADKQSALEQLEKAATTIANLNSVITSDQMLTTEQATKFKEAWETVFESFETANSKDWDTIFEGFNAAITTQNETLKEQAKEARIAALQIEQGLGEVEAQLVDRMNELVDKIITNTATDEEIEEYKQKMESFGVVADEVTQSFKKIVEGASTIDFSSAEDGVAAAIEFIKNVSDSYTETATAIDEGLAAQLESIESQKEKINTYLEKGLITEEQAKEWTNNLDNFAEIFKQTAEEKKDQIAQDMADAFALVLNTAKEGIKQYVDDNGDIDFEGASTYVDGVIRPIIQAIKDTDVDVNEALKSVFEFSEDLSDYIDYETLDELMSFITGEIGAAAAEAGKTIDLGNEIIYSMFNLANWDINDENKKEIATRLANSFGWDSAIDALKKYFDVDVSEMLNIYGWEDLETAEREALINSLINAYGTSAIGALKEKIPDIAIDEVLNIVHWEEFEDDQSLQFVSALSSAFGSNEAIQAAKSAGIDVAKMVELGLKSNDEGIKKQAEEWAKIIKEGTESDPPNVEVSVEADNSDIKKTKKNIETGVSGVSSIISSKTKKNSASTVKAEITKDTNGVVSVVDSSAKKGAASKVKDEIKKDVNGVVSVIDSAAKKGAAAAVKKEITTGVSGIVSVIDASEKKGASKAVKDKISKGVSGVVSTVDVAEKTNASANVKQKILNAVSGITAEVSATAGWKAGYPQNLGTDISNQTGTATASAAWKSGYPGNLGSDVNKQDGTVTAYAAFAKDELSDLKEEVEDVAPTVTAKVKVSQSGLDDLSTKLKNALETSIRVKSGGETVATYDLTAAASGGLFNSADIFLANENGNAELIGRFGNQTGVANQREIVAGISKGVYDANQEQNVLLRQQNDLLRGILAKEGNVRIEASSSLGRVAKRSLEMYGAMAGGR